MSPISATKNAKPMFREIGKIRKGIVVMSGGKNPKPRPKEVEYFVMDFLPEESEAEKLFFSTYGDTPTELKIVAPFDSIDDWWDGWYRCFKGGRMVANAGLNYEIDQEETYFERLYDVEHTCWVVKRWKTLECPDVVMQKWGVSGPGQALPVRFEENVDARNGEGLGPVIYKTVNQQTNKETKYFLKVTGTLKVMVRELRTFLGFLTLHTSGKVDVNNISGELAGLKLRADQANIPLHNLPLVLSRRKEGVRDPDGNLTYHYNVHVGLDAEFSRKLALLQDTRADSEMAGYLTAGQVPKTNDASMMLVDSGEDEEYFDTLPDDDGIIDAEISEEGEDIVIANYKDFWTYAEKLGLDLVKEKDTINSIWKGLQNDPAAAAFALAKLAGKVD